MRRRQNTCAPNQLLPFNCMASLDQKSQISTLVQHVSSGEERSLDYEIKLTYRTCRKNAFDVIPLQWREINIHHAVFISSGTIWLSTRPVGVVERNGCRCLVWHPGKFGMSRIAAVGVHSQSARCELVDKVNRAETLRHVCEHSGCIQHCTLNEVLSLHKLKFSNYNHTRQA
jgi:hypothetical protein